MTINHNGKCADCTAGNPSTSCVEIGQDVHINGGRAGDTDHSFLQCQSCGSVLVRIRDSGGLGGNGTFYQVLTRGLY